jgi:hypothetical protein
MKRIALLAAAAALAAPAVFAQTAATIANDSTIILEGPAQSRPIHGAVIAEAPVMGAPGTVAVIPNTTVLGGPPSVVTETTTVPLVTHYWNVPRNIGSRMDFQRWQALRP